MVCLWSATWLLLFNAGMIALLACKHTKIAHLRTRTLLAAISLVSLAALMLPPARGVIIYEYGLAGTPIPWGITVDKNGAVWFTEQSANRIAQIGVEYPIPTPGSVPWGIAASKDEEDIWFTEETAGQIGRFVPSSGIFYEFPLPKRLEEFPRPRGMTMNITKISTNFNKTPRYDVWFTEYGRSRIGHLYGEDAFHVRFSFYTIPLPPGESPWPAGPGAQPLCIAMSPIDYSIWFTEFRTNRISSLKLLEDGTALFRHYKIGEVADKINPWGIAVDPNGFVWVSESQRNCIGRLNPVTGEYVTFTIPTPYSEPHELAIEATTTPPYTVLNVWFTEYNGDKMGRYDPGLNVFFEYPIISTGGKPHGIAVSGPYGAVWFTEPFAQKIGTMYSWYAPPFVTVTTVGTITSAVTTSHTLSQRRTSNTSVTTSFTAAPYGVGGVGAPVTTVTRTYTFTSSMFQLTSTSIFSWTITSWTTSYTTTSTTTTATQVVVSVSTLPTTTSTTATATSTIVQTSSLTTSRTNTIVIASSSLTTTTLTATSTSNYPTVTVKLGNTSFIPTTTFSPTVTATSVRTSMVPTTSTATSILTTTTTTITTVAITRPCVVASAAYGSELAPEVQFLRGFRDRTTMCTFVGSQFMRIFNGFYYSFSPTMAQHVNASPYVAAAARVFMYPLLLSLRAAVSGLPILQSNPEIGLPFIGILASCLIGILYLTPALVVANILKRNLGRFQR